MNDAAPSSPSETRVRRWRARLRLLIRDNGGVASIAVFFAAMVVVFSLLTSTFLTEANILNILRQIAPLLIVAVAMTFVITTSGIDLSVGSILALVNALAAISLQAGALAVVVVLMLFSASPSASCRASSSPTKAFPPSSSRWRA